MTENEIFHRLLDVIQYKNSYQYETSGIQPQDMHLLERIYKEVGIKIKDVSLRYHIPPSTLTGMIDRLETKKYVERLRTAGDRRAVTLTVTEEGKRMVENHIREDHLFTRNLFDTLESERRELLKDLLAELVTKVKTESLFEDKQGDI